MPPEVEMWSLNLWTTREVLKLYFQNWNQFVLTNQQSQKKKLVLNIGLLTKDSELKEIQCCAIFCSFHYRIRVAILMLLNDN